MTHILTPRRRGTLLAALLLLITGFSRMQAQSLTQSAAGRDRVIVFHVDQLNGDADAKVLSSFLTKQFPDKIVACTADGQDHTATITFTESIQPIDILQIIRMRGYHSWFILNNQKFFLDAGGNRLLYDDIKPQ